MRGLQIQRQGSTRAVLPVTMRKRVSVRGNGCRKTRTSAEESEEGESMHEEGEGIAEMYRLSGAAPQVRTGPGQVQRALHARFTLSY